MKRMLLNFIAVVTMVVFVIGCGGTNKVAWQNDQVDSKFKKGMSTAELVQLLKQPTQKFTRDGIRVWVYKKPAENSTGFNRTVSMLDPFGLASGENSLRTDVLRFYIKDDKIIDFELKENVGSDILGGSKDEPSLPKNITEEKKIITAAPAPVHAPKPMSKPAPEVAPVVKDGLNCSCVCTNNKQLLPTTTTIAPPIKDKKTAKVKRSKPKHLQANK